MQINYKRPKRLSIEDIEFIYNERIAGKKPQEIADKLERPRSTVSSTIFRQQGRELAERIVVKHPYERMNYEEPIEYANRILIAEKRLVHKNGIWFLDHKIPTAINKIHALNHILKSKGLPQIGKNPSWIV